jgi:hypothetical protein
VAVSLHEHPVGVGDYDRLAFITAAPRLAV